MAVSEKLRSGAKVRLGLRPPYNSVGASTVGRWIKATLAEAGINSETYCLG